MCVGDLQFTFIISTTVLSAIIAIIVYSNGGDTTNSHILYWKLSLFLGMWRVRGLALMAKSIQALCKKNTHQKRLCSYPAQIFSSLSRHLQIFLSSPHFFLNYSPPSSYLLALGKWWWLEPRICWRRRRGRPRSTPRKRWTFPSGTPGSGPGSHKSHPLNVSAPCGGREGNSLRLQAVGKYLSCMWLSVFKIWLTAATPLR